MARTSSMVPRALGWAVALALGATAVSVFRDPEPAPVPPPSRAVAHEQRVFTYGGDAERYAELQGVKLFEARHDTLLRGDTRIVVVPHHLVASEAIALGIHALRAEQSERVTVLLVTPDHFSACPTWVCTATGTFRTQFGDVPTDDGAVKKLAQESIVTVQPSLFDGEHGVHAVTPFVARYLPGARIVPIALAQHGTPPRAVRDALRASVRALFEASTTTLLVVSSDFSHYLPLKEADARDKETTAALCAGTSDDLLALINPSQSDCPLCLWLARELANAAHAQPSILWHSNSATLLKGAHASETTSHFVVAYQHGAYDTPRCGDEGAWTTNYGR